MLGSSGAAAVVEESKKLVCWDFDGTVTTIACHTHNLLTEGGFYGKDSAVVLQYYIDNILKAKNIRDLDALARAFIYIYEQGHHQAITTFNQFPVIIVPTIRFILETYLKKQNDDKDTLAEDQVALIDSLLDKLYVVGGFPSSEGIPKIKGGNSAHPDAKQQHIRRAQEHFKILEAEDVCLIDDNQNNCIVAEYNGHRAIYAEIYCFNASFYLNQILVFLSSEAEKQKIVSLSVGVPDYCWESYSSSEEDDEPPPPSSATHESEEDDELLFVQDQVFLLQFKELSVGGRPKGLRCSMDDAKSDKLDSLVGRNQLVQSGG